jgi:hypothetical protein
MSSKYASGPKLTPSRDAHPEKQLASRASTSLGIVIRFSDDPENVDCPRLVNCDDESKTTSSRDPQRSKQFSPIHVTESGIGRHFIED